MTFTSTEAETRTNADIPYIVRFNPNGVIDMYNKNTYTQGALNYEVGKQYDFRIVIRPDKMTYDAYVTPQGGEEIVIGENCGARQSAPIITRVDKMWTWASTDGCYKVWNVSLVQKDDKKTEPLGNGYYDESGLVFGKYRFSNTSVFPTISEDGLIMNWTEGGSYRPELGGSMKIFVGLGENSSRNAGLVEILRTVGLLDNALTPQSYVTPATISRILVAIKQGL
jgi:hypothetical protein